MNIRLSTTNNFHNKDNRAPMRPDKDGNPSNLYAYGAYGNVTMPIGVLVKHVTSGKTFCVAALTKNWRHGDNFQSAQIMGVDFDQSPGVDALLADAFVRDHAFLVYPTPSHTEEAPRSRILFALDTPITDQDQYRLLIKRLMHRFNMPVDEGCKDTVRQFHGSDLMGWKANETAVLPLSVLEGLPPHPDELKPPIVRREPTPINDDAARRRAEAYGKATKEGIIADAIATPANVGQRHAAFNEAAMNLIARVKGGWYGMENVEADLRWLGQQMGEDEKEVEASIRGAWSKATAYDFALPENGNHAASEPQRAPAQQRHGEPDVVAPAVIWRTSAETQQRYRDSFDKPRTNGTMPLVVPFKALHPFGGYARILDVGVLVGVVGMSGGMKTSFLETFTDACRQREETDVMWWGNEWTPDGMASRAVQRYGGARVDDKLMHDLWLIESEQGVPIEQRYGKALPMSVERESKKISGIIESWAGQNHQIEDPVTDINVLLALFAEQIKYLREHGRKVRMCVWDYVQLLDLYSARTESEKITTLLGKLKMFAIEHQVVGFVASQVTKQSSGAAKAGDDVLQAESGQHFRSDKFNLVLTLNPVYEGKLLTNRGVINVAKNSTGKTGVQTVFIDPSKFKWIDKAVPENQQVKQEDIDDVEF
jgi:hypothetical protein